MEHEEIVTAIHELAEFASTTAKTLESHKGVLTRHEEILGAEYTAGVTHRDAIEALRKDMLALGNLVNSQPALIESMQRALVKVVNDLGISPEEPLPGAIN